MHNVDESSTMYIGVSVDGTWQRRGFTSLNGVLIAISVDNGKIIDLECMSRYCRQCDVTKRRLKDQPYKLKMWMQEHKDECQLNHDGSAPSMEVEGAKALFSRSIVLHGVRYTGYYGDGDSKAYGELKTYYGDDHPVIKYECIGHYQKRVGTRLRKLKKTPKV